MKAAGSLQSKMNAQIANAVIKALLEHITDQVIFRLFIFSINVITSNNYDINSLKI